MKIDHQYLKDLLIAFEDHYAPFITVKTINDGGIDNSNKFIGHMLIIHDKGLIARLDGDSGIGYLYGMSGWYWDNSIPLRLTAQGHDFIADLRQKEVWETIKTNFKEEGISTLMGLSKSLALSFAKKKVKDVTGFDIE